MNMYIHCAAFLGKRIVGAGLNSASSTPLPRKTLRALASRNKVFYSLSGEYDPGSIADHLFGTAGSPVQVCFFVQNPSLPNRAVVTQPDVAEGACLKIQPTLVKLEAKRWNLPVWQPMRAGEKPFVDSLSTLHPDLIVVAAYGQILPTTILELPRCGCLNVHASLLPKYRGAAPIQWALLNNEAETGVTIMKMDAGLDTGPILTQSAIPILCSDNAQTLHDRLARWAPNFCWNNPDYVAGKITPNRNQRKIPATRKIAKEDGQLNWNQPARVLWNQVRAFTPWPGAFTFLEIRGKRRLLKILQAEIFKHDAGQPSEIFRCENSELVIGCGEQGLNILQLQLEGGKRMTAQEFLAGHRLQAGQKAG
jgi:methionyl-tRNA formyltransferase